MTTNNIDVLKWSTLRPQLPDRDKQAHKGLFGHVLVLGGNRGLLGAARLAGEAALRVGAGLVSLATRPDHAALIAAIRPELMCHGVENEEECQALLSRATVVVVGPGLGQDSWVQLIIKCAFDSALPKIVDADALNLLAHSPFKRQDWILTPHPGEAGRLLGISGTEVQVDRLKALQSLQQTYGGVVVLKGAGTLIQGEDFPPVICEQGNPGMAAGGMGDVLSGVIAGLLAQGLSLQLAAKLGVSLHAWAGDFLAKSVGQRGYLASDLVNLLPYILNETMT
ncbi:MAG: NAD(P)H-hydrate dehydratase [Gammaproteobacteria bacterium]